MDSRKDKFVRINYQPELQRTEYQQKSFLHSFVLEIKANKLAIAAVIFLMVIFVAVLLAPLSPYDPDKMDVVHKLQPRETDTCLEQIIWEEIILQEHCMGEGFRFRWDSFPCWSQLFLELFGERSAALLGGLWM